MNLVTTEILEFLKTELTGSDIKTFYNGEVILVPRSYCPAIMVFGTEQNISAYGTAKDEHVYSITIRVVYDVTPFFNETGVDEVIKAQEALMNIMGERATSTTLEDGTIIAAIRKNTRGDSYLFNDNLKISYKMLESNKYFYVSADVIVEAKSYVLRPT